MSFAYQISTAEVSSSLPAGDAGAEVVCRVVALGDCMLQLLDLSSCGLTDRCAGCLKGLLEGAR